MKALFYPKLAATNIRKNGRFYFPFILTCIGSVAMFYLMSSITFSDGLNSMRGSESLKFVLILGCIVVGLFSLIFLFYTNSFLMKRRKKELGLYNILGMGKRHIAKILACESLFVFFTSILAGILFGIVFYKLIIMGLYRLLDFEVSVKFQVAPIGVISTVLLYAGIFLLILISNLARIKLSKPIDLLHGGQIGEREPKTKWLMTIIGLLCIGVGYTIAIVVKSPVDALLLFFVAVLLVIIGTYCLFTAGSIALLKLLRKNKSYYYKTNHFTAVSGMIYRMKQNAVGLANICILSTMVLVMVSTTVSMYVGTEDSLNTMFPRDVEVTFYNSSMDMVNDREQTVEKIMNATKQLGKNPDRLFDWTYLNFTAVDTDDGYSCNKPSYNSSSSDLNIFMAMTSDEFTRITGERLSLSDGEIAAYCASGKIKDKFKFGDREFTTEKILDKCPSVNNYMVYIANVYYIISTDSDFNYFYNVQAEQYQESASQIKHDIWFDIDGTDSEKIDFYDDLSPVVDKITEEKSNTDDSSYCVSAVDSKQASRSVYYMLNGGFLFLGIFLGGLFLMATVLIIYYKQISEGYEDKERFDIMQKVGMSRSEIKKSIGSQVVIVFFLPLAVACIHILAAFKLITRLMTLLGLSNIALFGICTLISVAVFSLIYLIVYLITSRIYLKIVE